MGVRTSDTFGSAPDLEPATPGSYGEAPGGFRLPAATSVGAVTLQVADLERSLEYYRTILGLAQLGRDAGGAVLGARVRSSICASGAAPSPPVAAGTGSSTSRSCCPTDRRWAASSSI